MNETHGRGVFAGSELSRTEGNNSHAAATRPPLNLVDLPSLALTVAQRVYWRDRSKLIASAHCAARAAARISI